MRIERIETYPLRIVGESSYMGSERNVQGHYFYPAGRRTVYPRAYEVLWLKVTTSDGITGWGECLSPVVPKVAATIIEELLRPLLIGADPFDSDPLYERMYDSMRERGHMSGFFLDAVAAVDIALWDIKGKALNVPVYALLGGPHRTEIPAYVSGLSGTTQSDIQEQVRRWNDQGMNRFKLHLGFGLERDLTLIDWVREAGGPNAWIAFDGHGMYRHTDALLLAERLLERGAVFLEAPIAPEDRAGHAALVRSTRLPIAVGEGERSRYQFRDILVDRAASLLQPDVGRTGLSELMKIAHLAHAFHVPVAPHLSILMGPAVAATLHADLALPNFVIQEYQPKVLEVGAPLLKTPLRVSNGQFTLPEGPGLGISIAEEVVKRFAI